MLTARAVAVSILNDARTAHAWASDLIDQHLSRIPLAANDRRFVMQLVYGVIRRKATLDTLLKPFIRRPFHEVEPVLLDILRVGAFQIGLLTQVPRHAAVYETVHVAERIGRSDAKRFINGVLRRIAEVVADEFAPFAAADTIPFDASPTPRYRRLRHELLPNPHIDFPAYFASGFSLPGWLADRWLQRYSQPEALRLGFWFNSTPPLWLRVNRLKLDREAYRIILTANGIDCELGPHPQSLRLTEALPIRELPGYSDGAFTIQDLSAMTVATALAPQPGWRVLDLCAAPGGKTTHLAELMNNRGTIVACDVDPGRLKTMTTLCQRLGVTIVEPHLLEKFASSPPPGPYDAALVDVPCSNTGVLARRPEVRWRLRPGEFPDLIQLQTRLLLTAVEQVKPGGIVVYSTCSIEPEENQGVIAAVQRGIPSLILEAEQVSVPGQPSDGGYWARLRLPERHPAKSPVAKPRHHLDHSHPMQNHKSDRTELAE